MPVQYNMQYPSTANWGEGFFHAADFTAESGWKAAELAQRRAEKEQELWASISQSFSRGFTSAYEVERNAKHQRELQLEIQNLRKQEAQELKKQDIEYKTSADTLDRQAQMDRAIYNNQSIAQRNLATQDRIDQRMYEQEVFKDKLDTIEEHKKYQRMALRGDGQVYYTDPVKATETKNAISSIYKDDKLSDSEKQRAVIDKEYELAKMAWFEPAPVSEDVVRKHTWTDPNTGVVYKVRMRNGEPDVSVLREPDKDTKKVSAGLNWKDLTFGEQMAMLRIASSTVTEYDRYNAQKSGKPIDDVSVAQGLLARMSRDDLDRVMTSEQPPLPSTPQTQPAQPPPIQTPQALGGMQYSPGFMPQMPTINNASISQRTQQPAPQAQEPQGPSSPPQPQQATDAKTAKPLPRNENGKIDKTQLIVGELYMVGTEVGRWDGKDFIVE